MPFCPLSTDGQLAYRRFVHSHGRLPPTRLPLVRRSLCLLHVRLERRTRHRRRNDPVIHDVFPGLAGGHGRHRAPVPRPGRQRPRLFYTRPHPLRPCLPGALGFASWTQSPADAVGSAQPTQGGAGPGKLQRFHRGARQWPSEHAGRPRSPPRNDPNCRAPPSVGHAEIRSRTAA